MRRSSRSSRTRTRWRRQYYGVTHPSEPNYVAAISGSNWFVQNDNPANRFDHTNLVDQLEAEWPDLGRVHGVDAVAPGTSATSRRAPESSSTRRSTTRSCSSTTSGQTRLGSRTTSRTPRSRRISRRSRRPELRLDHAEPVPRHARRSLRAVAPTAPTGRLRVRLDEGRRERRRVEAEGGRLREGRGHDDRVEPGLEAGIPRSSSSPMKTTSRGTPRRTDGRAQQAAATRRSCRPATSSRTRGLPGRERLAGGQYGGGLIPAIIVTNKGGQPPATSARRRTTTTRCSPRSSRNGVSATSATRAIARR